MNLVESFMTAISSLSSNKLRSFLTMLGVIIGVAAVVAMVSAGEGARTEVTSQIGSLGSNLVTVTPGRVRALPGMAFGARGESNILTYSHFTELKQARLPGVAAILAEASTRKVIRYGKNSTTTTVIGTTPEYCDIRNYHTEFGRFFAQYDLDRMTSVVVLGRTVAEDLFGRPETALNEIIRIGNVNFRVIGVMEDKTMGGRDLGDQLFVPITTAQTRLTGNRYLQNIVAKAASVKDTDLVYNQLYGFFLRKLKDPEKFTITNQQDILNTIENVTGTFTLLLARLISRFLSWSTTISLTSVGIALGVSIGVGLFFGIYPAQRASRLSPIVALRYE